MYYIKKDKSWDVSFIVLFCIIIYLLNNFFDSYSSSRVIYLHNIKLFDDFVAVKHGKLKILVIPTWNAYKIYLLDPVMKLGT